MQRHAHDGADANRRLGAGGNEVVEGALDRGDVGLDPTDALPLPARPGTGARYVSDSAAPRSASTSLVASQLKSFSGRPKWP